MSDKMELLTKNYVVNENIIKLAITTRLNVYEFLIIVYVINDDSKKLDVQAMSDKLFIDNNTILTSINSLIEKGLIKLVSKKDENNKMADYIDIDSLLLSLKEIKSATKKSKDKNNIYSVFEREFGRTITSMEYEIINAWLDNFSEEMILLALKEAVYNGVTNFRYIDKILYEWKKKNLKTKSEIENYNRNRNRDNNKKNDVLFDYDWTKDETK